MGAVAGVAVGAQVIGGLMQAQGQYQQGQDQAAALRQNAILARVAASDAIQRGQQEAGQVRMQASQVIGQQQVAAGASGVDASTGTAATVAGMTRMFSEMDALTIRNNSAREAWGLRTQATQMVSAAKQAQRAGTNAAVGGALGALGSAAGSAYGLGKAHGWWGAGVSGSNATGKAIADHYFGTGPGGMNAGYMGRL